MITALEKGFSSWMAHPKSLHGSVFFVGGVLSFDTTAYHFRLFVFTLVMGQIEKAVEK